MSLFAMLSAEPVVFSTRLGPILRSSPSVSGDRFDVWSRAVHRADGAWETAGGVAFAENASRALLPEGSLGLALVADAHTRHEGAFVRASLCREDRWVFAFDGNIEDRAYLFSRTNLSRASPGKPDGALLLAFLLSRLDERGLAQSAATDAVDDVVRAAALEMVQRIGSFSFLLCDGTALYAHRFDRSVYLGEREPRGALPAAVVIASEPLTSENWVPLEDRTLMRCRKLRSMSTGARTLDLAFLSGRDPRSRASEVELPFTD